ncbi:hypothetical protein DESC_700184 [Desulfosarcina cetonica]|nr:hypothetical protein DESC_700184 [Desulfosarcina cetonica]
MDGPYDQGCPIAVGRWRRRQAARQPGPYTCGYRRKAEIQRSGSKIYASEHVAPSAEHIIK